MRKILLLIILAILYGEPGHGQNPSQWRGNERNGNYSDEKDLMKEWPVGGPEKLWSITDIGSGYSSATSAYGMVFITGMADSSEIMTGIDLEGNVKWKTVFGTGWTNSYPGSRSAPVYENGRLYISSGTGEIVCLDAENGEIIWKLDAFEKFEGICTMWGTGESLLIVEDKLFYTPGGNKTTMVALNKNTGETIWESESIPDSTAYVSPLFIEYGTRKIITSILANHFIGVDANNGELLWKYNYYNMKWKQDHWYSPIINVNTPVYSDGQIFITKGYNHKAAMFSLEKDGRGIELLWTDTILDVHLGGAVVYDNFLYGSNWIHNRAGNWCCLNWETGELMWEVEWNNKGSIILADELLYCYEEKQGTVALVQPSPEEFKIISTFQVTEGTGPHWAHPVIHNGLLFIRHGQVLMAYDLRKN